MQLAIVQGRATSTIKHPSMAGQKLLVCQQLDAEGRPAGDPIIAVDQLGAGTGDRVILTSDGEGLQKLIGDKTSPLRWWTLGIVDE